MPRAVDLKPEKFQLTHDPTNQLTWDNPLGKAGEQAGLMVLQIPGLIVRALLGTLGGVLNPGAALNLALGVLSSFGNVLRALMSGMTPSPADTDVLAPWLGSGGPFGGVLGFFTTLRALPAQITEHTEAIARLEDVLAATNTTVAYVGDIQDMVTVPRSQLTTLGESDGTKIRNIIGGSIPQNATLRDVMPAYYPGVQLGVTVGHIYYTPIVVDRHGVVDKLRWIVGADTSIFSLNYYEVALCIYNPDNGNIEKVYGSGDIKDGVASTTTLREVELSMGIVQQCRPGQLLFFAHQQTAPGLFQGPRAFAAVPQGNVGRPSTTLLDAACYVAPNHSQGIPSSIALSSLTRENRFIPWGAVTVNAIEQEDDE